MYNVRADKRSEAPVDASVKKSEDNMNALFKSIRHSDLDAVKKAVEKNPGVVNEIYTAKAPKKDIGLSPLQVALKVGEFEIVRYLLEQGADPDFMEDPKTVPPHSTCKPILCDAVHFTMDVILSPFDNAIEQSEKYLDVVRELLNRGADPNKETFKEEAPANSRPALGELAGIADYVFFRHKDHDAERYQFAKKQMFTILDLLLDHGADFEAWLDGGSLLGLYTNRECYWDGVSSKDGKELKVGQYTREVLKEYFASRSGNA